MKKLLAILLSMLLLCGMIPFAAVSAAGDYTIELVADAEEVNAGDELVVEVSLYGHESVGIIAALLKLDFDHDVFELETYYDEDEEMWMPPIEVGPKFSASSNKYITWPPIDEETGYMEHCSVQFNRATASASQAVKTNLFYTVTFKVKDDAPSGTYTIDIKDHNDKNLVMHGNKWDTWTWEPITITVNGSEPAGCEHEYEYDCSKNCSKCGEETRPEAAHEFFNDCETVCMICYQEVREASHNVIHVEAKDATCTAGGNIEYWYCDVCGAAWLNAECTLPTNLRAVNLPMAEHTYFDDCSAICDVCGYEREVSHNVIHVEAKAPTCTELGNIEYWYCDVCGAAWLDEACTLNTNMMAVKLGATCSTNAIYTAAKDATCYEPGNVEYWYCANCDVYYLDAACTIITNAKSVVLPIAHNVIHVEAKDANCFEPGNIEYWYCDICGSAWTDELLREVTNLKNVVTPISHNIIHVEAKDATCTEPGNIEYWYCDICGSAWTDELLREVTNLKNVVLPITHNVIHVEAKDATCTEPGNIEYWYCDICGSAWTDELLREVTNLKNVVLPITHNVIHVEAKDANCFEPGNIEYWYCDICGSAWTDELLREVTNLKNVVLPITHNVIHVEAKDATCTELGNIEYWYCDICGSAWLDEYCHLNTNMMAVKLPMAEHTYADEFDTDCNVCGAIRVADYEVKTFGGTSFKESEDGLSGLAFRFDLTDKIQGMAVVEGTKYVADYSGATVIPKTDNISYTLVKMGAKVSNGKQTLDVPVQKIVLSDTESFYAIRIINIPEDKYDVVIECTPYFVYENAEGELVTVYGDTYEACLAEQLD